MAAGISPTFLSHSEVVAAMSVSITKMNSLIADFIEYRGEVDSSCTCAEAMKEFGGFKL
jgi:5'-methylthioadenosine phosphorylase